MNKQRSAEETINDQYNAMMREFYMRNDEIIGGRLDCLSSIAMIIVINGWDDPHIIIKREITAIPNIL